MFIVIGKLVIVNTQTVLSVVDVSCHYILPLLFALVLHHMHALCCVLFCYMHH